MTKVMNPFHRNACEAAAIGTRLALVLGTARMPAGTPISQTLFDIFHIEARHRGREEAMAAWAALDDAAIATLARTIVKFFSRESSADYRLPAGTEMMECMTGCAFIDGEIFGFDVDRPGLHPQHELPDRVGGSNLNLLLRLVGKISRDVPWGAIGAPTLVTRHHELHPNDRLQFPPFGPAAGAVLICELNYTSWGEYFCAFSRGWVRDCAEKIVGEMRSLWTSCEELAPHVREAERAATEIASRRDDVRFHAVTVDLRDWGHGRASRLAVEFETWDHGFRPGITVYDIPKNGHAESALNTSPLDHAAKAAAAHALGADGWIGGLARAAVLAAEAQDANPLRDLATADETIVSIDAPGGPVHLRFHWRAGEIRVSTRRARKLEISDGNILLIDEMFPDTIIDSLPGRPLLAVFDQPFRCHTLIATAQNTFRGVAITLQPDLILVDCVNSQAIVPQAAATTHVGAGTRNRDKPSIS